MATLAQVRDALLARTDVLSASQWFAPDNSDSARQAIGAAVKRRIEIVKRLSDGKTRMEIIDRGVLDLGGAGEQVIDEGAGPGAEQEDRKNAFRLAAESWLATNAKTREPKLLNWKITGVDEALRTATVVVTLNNGADPLLDLDGPFVQATYWAGQPGGAGATVYFGPISQG